VAEGSGKRPHRPPHVSLGLQDRSKDVDSATFTDIVGGWPAQTEFYSCFISYSSKDAGFASRLHAELQKNGVKCWFAPEDIKIGEEFRQRIDDAIREYDKLLLVLSEHSVRSDWVQDEVEACFERERKQRRQVLFPIRVDTAVSRTRQAWAASIRRRRHIGDFTNWHDAEAYERAFERLIRDLKAQNRPL
jgi:TIR domain